MLILTMSTAWACSEPVMPECRYPTALLLGEEALEPPGSSAPALPENVPLLFHVPPDYVDDWRASVVVRTTWQGGTLPRRIEYDAPIAKVWLDEAFEHEEVVEVRYWMQPAHDEKRSRDIVRAPPVDVEVVEPTLTAWTWDVTPATACGEPTDGVVDLLALQTDAPFGTVLLESSATPYATTQPIAADGSAELVPLAADDFCAGLAPGVDAPLTVTVIDRHGNRSAPVSIDPLDGPVEISPAGCGCATPAPLHWSWALLLMPMLRRRAQLQRPTRADT